MGGSGSTRWRGHWRRQTIGEAPLCLSLQGSRFGLDLPTMKKARMTWTDRKTGATRAEIGVTFGPREAWGKYMTLTYTATPSTRAPAKVQTRLRVEATPQPFGGVRWWLVCPWCHRRRAALFIPNSLATRFRCRACLRLAYQSQRTDSHERARQRVRHVADHIARGAAPSEMGDEWPPPRPKGMHHRTYRRLVEAWARANYRLELLEHLRLARCFGRAAWLFLGDPAELARARELAKSETGVEVERCPDADGYVSEWLAALGYPAVNSRDPK